LTKFIKRKNFESTYLSSTNDSICIRCDVTVVEDISEESVVLKSNLHQHLGDLLGSEVGGDVTFEVSGDELVAPHKDI
jgi:speckle-type POZ protein